MADVRTTAVTARDRGQMLLVAAFGVAVMLVALALILNTSIYTENIATRGSDISGGKDALRYRAVTEESLQSTLKYVNENNNTTGSYSIVTDPATHAIWNYSNMSGRLQATDSIVANVSVRDRSSSNPAEGTHVYQQTDEHNLSNEAGTDWTVASGSQGIRRFRINATDDASEADDVGLAPLTEGAASTGEQVFYVEIVGSSETYKVFIYEKSGTNKFVVEVKDSSTDYGTCVRDYQNRGGEDRAVVNLTNGSAAGQHCEPLTEWWSIIDEDLDVSFENTCLDATSTGLLACNAGPKGTANPTIEGNYTVVVNESYTSVESRTAVDTDTMGSNDFIQMDGVVYSITVHMTYESKRLYYETDVRAAPGEPE